MKKGALAFAVLLFISGMLRIAGSDASKPQGTGATNIGPEGKIIDIAPGVPYLEELKDKIQDFYGVPQEDHSRTRDLPSLFSLLEQPPRQVKRDQVQFVIAILPDPVHTRLSLFFDRGIEAVQQAAQRKGYAFDRAILPWRRTPGAESSELKTGSEQAGQPARREAYPGLLLFREPNENLSTTPISPLFVLVVGETPTRGLNKEQFRNAVQIISQISGTSPLKQNAQPLLILGPSFSGSLDSLHQELQQDLNETFIYSGTVTGSRSMDWFEKKLYPSSHFASFQENDDYAQSQFLQFACDRGYQPDEIAILSEDGTVYGDTAKKPEVAAGHSSTPLPKCRALNHDDSTTSDPLQLHFPREISYFRSAYQKEAASQQPSTPKPDGTTTLTLDLNDGGHDDDLVEPYAATQTPVSQQAVMLGITSELQKHHIKFTILLATDPLDELFLAKYLLTNYQQGRVVVTNPDLLFAGEENMTLRGVLGLNVYPLVPGLRDKLCHQEKSPASHEDPLYVSSLSVGTFNAMVGLLSVSSAESHGWKAPTPFVQKSGRASFQTDEALPTGPYSEYGSPLLSLGSQKYCEGRPLLWLTILGRSGFWPIATFTDRDITIESSQEHVVFVPQNGYHSTLKTAAASNIPTESDEAHPPLAWKIAYWLCLLLLMIHAILSWSGSVLADSEAKAQFARTDDWRDAAIIAVGALVLVSAFVIVMCTRRPRIVFDFQTFPLWLPLPLFVIASALDLGRLRGQPRVAMAFASIAVVITGYQILHLWSRGERLLQFASGVSPVLPVLLLLGAGYWWMWQGLRGVTLVDLRRPRLPARNSLSALSVVAYRISDTEGEELRRVAHPFVFAGEIVYPILGLALIALTLLDRKHPIQTLEGRSFDWGYSLLLGCMIATLFGSLLKLVWTWLKCRQILGGLNRFPLREAFSRMNGLSWRSFWNPGGSSLRETYKLMAFTMETLGRLDHVLATDEASSQLPPEVRAEARAEIKKTEDARSDVILAYSKVVPENNAADDKKVAAAPPLRSVVGLIKDKLSARSKRKARERRAMPRLLTALESLQKQTAQTAATLMAGVLSFHWANESRPVVSKDERLENPQPPLSRALAEEFVALVYVNFLVTVLLRVRTLVLTAGGIYVLVVISINAYPFEPRLALQTLSVLLILTMGAVVGYVYAEMHRDVILSRLTSTAPGELGIDFWIKFGSAAALPVFSLLAAQFPEIRQFLFSWLEPALQSVR
jgi:hypothetical protein